MSKPVTQKSFKSQKRDKVKHSVRAAGEKAQGAAKKGGAGGRGTWGKPGDELKNDEDLADEGDPNFDPMDNPEYDAAVYVPQEDRRAKFVAGIQQLNLFKRKVKQACDEYLTNNEADEFVKCIKELDLGLYLQDLPYVVIKQSLDKTDDERRQICLLLKHLDENEVLSPRQMGQGFKKLYNQLNDLIIDTPNAKAILTEYTNYAVLSKFLDKQLALAWEAESSLSPETVAAGKATIRAALVEYFESADKEDLAKTVAELDPQLRWEVVKSVISFALDRTNRERELASSLVAELTGEAIRLEDTEKAFSVLLGRVEDLFLDVPNVHQLLSCFLARAVVDEALPPSFTGRLDLSEADMGYEVVMHATALLEGRGAGRRMGQVWEEVHV